MHDLLLALQRDGQLTELALGPLDTRETAALATAVTGQPLTPEQNSYLYAQMEGNPLFVVETVRAEVGRGGLCAQSGVLLPLPAPLARIVVALANGQMDAT